MKNNYRRIIEAIVLCLFLIIQFFIIPVFADGETTMSILPYSSIVSESETFMLSVYCEPSKPMKSFEFSLSFDETLLQANSVTEGDIFAGYNNFYNSGIIDNVNGEITAIYNLIIGAGNVTSPGYLVNISFTSQGISGVSSINLFDAGITNETVYLPLIVSNGSVVIDASAPNVVDNSPVIGTTGDSYIFNVSVTDAVDDSSIVLTKVNWMHSTSGNNDSMVFVGGSYFEKTVTLDDSISDMVYTLYVEDAHGNSYTTSSSLVSVSDNDAPDVSDLLANPASQVKDGVVNLSAEVTDNIMVASVFLNVTYPDDSYYNISVFDNHSGNTFYSMKSYSMIGWYSFRFWAEDTLGNGVLSSSASFNIADVSIPKISDITCVYYDPMDTDELFGWVNISCTVTDDELNLVYLNYIDRNDLSINVSMEKGTGDLYYYNKSFTVYGNYSYFIWCNDTSENSNTSSVFSYSLPPNWDVNNDGNVTVFDLTLISNHYLETGSPGWIREDVDNDGEIKVIDIVLCANHYNERWW